MDKIKGRNYKKKKGSKEPMKKKDGRKGKLKIKKEMIRMKRWTKEEETFLIKNAPSKTGDYLKLGNEVGRTSGAVRKKCAQLNLPNVKHNSQSNRIKIPLEDRILTVLSKGRKKRSIEELSDLFNVCVKKIRVAIGKLRAKKIIIDVIDDGIVLSSTIAPPEPVKIPMEIFNNSWIKFGIVSDPHLNSKYQRLDVLNHSYDIFESEGIKDVFVPGNIIDGYGRLNQFDVFNIGTESQIKYLVENYPKRKGITTHFITADDHEGWIIKREHINIGERIEDVAKRMNRGNDLNFIGHVEADIHIKVGSKPTVIRLFHPGGGISYAMSYKPQKIVESLQGGDKPDILIVGHFHKLGAFEWRNVEIILAGCMEDQTPFMRKKNIAAHIGFYIIKAHIAPDGSVNRLIPEKIRYFNKNYYTAKSWNKSPEEFDEFISKFVFKW